MLLFDRSAHRRPLSTWAAGAIPNAPLHVLRVRPGRGTLPAVGAEESETERPMAFPRNTLLQLSEAPCKSTIATLALPEADGP